MSKYPVRQKLPDIDVNHDEKLIYPYNLYIGYVA